MSVDLQRRWCLFTSAGDKNNIQLWLDEVAPRRWDLVTAYYGDNDHLFQKISNHCLYSFPTKGSKFQNLRKLFLDQPGFFDRYSHVWVCDDDIVMSPAQIDEAFELTERLGFWVAQPATSVAGKNGHWITCYAGPRWDYRIVNYVEVGLPIFQRDKLVEFLNIYDGSLTGWGIDYWYANVFQADDFGRFAVLDRVQVVNPRDEVKGANEMGRLRASALRENDWNAVRQKFGLIEHPHKILAYCRIAPEPNVLRLFNAGIDPEYAASIGSRLRMVRRLIKAGLAAKALLETVRRSNWHDAWFLLAAGLSTRLQRRAVGHGFEQIGSAATGTPPTEPQSAGVNH